MLNPRLSSRLLAIFHSPPGYAKMSAREAAPPAVAPTAQLWWVDAQVTPNRRPRGPTFGTVTALQPLRLHWSIPALLTAQQSRRPALETASRVPLATTR